MNRGAQQATGEWLWFLHADSAGLTRQLALIRALPAGAQWGRFDVRLSGERLLFRVIGTLINWRSRLTGVATGDQGLFIRRRLFEESGGYPDQPLMEDVALTARLKRHDRPVCLAPAIITSSRRWEAHGVWRTIWLMWSLRWRYWRGADPVILHRDYYGHG